jgi:hypothetical protein
MFSTIEANCQKVTISIPPKTEAWQNICRQNSYNMTVRLQKIVLFTSPSFIYQQYIGHQLCMNDRTNHTDFKCACRPVQMVAWNPVDVQMRLLGVKAWHIAGKHA